MHQEFVAWSLSLPHVIPRSCGREFIFSLNLSTLLSTQAMAAASLIPRDPHEIHELLEGPFEPREEERAIQLFHENGWKLASLVDAYLTLFKESLNKTSQPPVPTLLSLASKKIAETLSDEVGFRENIDNVSKSLAEHPELQSLLVDSGQLPYPAPSKDRQLWKLCLQA